MPTRKKCVIPFEKTNKAKKKKVVKTMNHKSYFTLSKEMYFNTARYFNCMDLSGNFMNIKQINN